ncbi:MAG: DUF973 family protein [Ignisphaera sp.]|uniref:DUF973 family protein n=1 Tax=Ignisphaera aggregans TaxID=334771 RepID=A0A7J3MY44_9CREN
MESSQSSVSTESKSIAIEGLRKLRTGAIIFIVATLLVGATLIVAISAILATAFAEGETGVLMGLTTVLGLAIVGFILNLVGLFGFMIPGVSKLVKWNEKFSTSSKLLKIGYGGGIVLLLIAIIIILAGAFALNPGIILGGLALAVIGGIVLFIGYIGLIILSFKLNDIFKVTSLMVAGILFVIGIFVGILQFVAWILMFVGLGSAIEKLESGSV